MKRIYVLTATLLIGGCLMGQSLNNYNRSTKKMMHAATVQNNNAVQIFKNASYTPNPQAVIWSENFAGGFPAAWTKNNLGADPIQWEYRTPTTNNVPTTSRLNSTTKSNGYMVYNSDAGGDNALAEDNSFKTSSIDLTGKSNISLQFEQQYDHYLSITTVIVSDGANSQTYTINNGSVNPNVNTNAASPNPELVVMNISAIAGNKSNVTLEFRWEGSWDYWWQIDDIAIVDAAINDMAVDEYYFYGYEDSSATRYYTHIPFMQASNDTILFGCDVRNVGGGNQPNVVVSASVTGPSSFSGSSAPIATVPVGSLDSANLTGSFFPSADTGTYTIVFSVSSDSIDENMTNNSVTGSFHVSDTVYARDNDTPSSGGWYGSAKPYRIGNVYEIKTPDTATSISVFIAGYQNPAFNSNGDLITFHLYDFSGDAPVLMASNEFYEIQTTDLNTWVTLAIPPTPLAPGWYLAALESYADTMLFISGGQTTPPLTVFVDVEKIDDWGYSTSSTPFVRLNTKAAFNPCSVSISASTTNVQCFSGNNGAINLTATGAGPFTYSWSNGATTEDLSGIGAGIYTVTVSVSGCPNTTGTYTINEPLTAVSATSSATGACSGTSNGTATVTASGGTAPYTYGWSNGQTGQTSTGLTNGTYNVTVSDSKQCTISATAMVASLPQITATMSTTDPACGSNDGAATVTPTAGGSSYTYSWNSTPAQTTQTVTGLGANSYTVVVTSNTGCSATFTASLSNPGAPVVTSSSTNVTCNGASSGSITVSASGGATPYTFTWTPNVGSDSTATNLAAGTYSVVVAGTDGCQASQSVTITQPAAIALTTLVTDDSGAGTGAVDLTVAGGVPPYTYSWSNGATTQNISGLTGNNTYTVVVIDSNGCADTVSAPVFMVGINEMPERNVIAVFPNPNNGTFNVKFTNANGNYVITLKNVLGQVVYSETSAISGSGIKNIGLSGLSHGIYYLSIAGENVHKTKKIVVK